MKSKNMPQSIARGNCVPVTQCQGSLLNHAFKGLIQLIPGKTLETLLQ